MASRPLTYAGIHKASSRRGRGKVSAIMYEPVRSTGSGLVEGGVTHAVNTDHIEDIQIWGDMARICLVSGAQLDVTRHEACLLLNALDECGEGASREITRAEDAGRSYEKAKSDAANLKGGGAG